MRALHLNLYDICYQSPPPSLAGLASLRTSNLQALCLTSSELDKHSCTPGGPDLRKRFLDRIQPLTLLPTLEHVDVDFPYSDMFMTTADLVQILTSWPLLKFVRFNFGCRRDEDVDTRAPALDALGKITQACPLLFAMFIPAFAFPFPQDPELFSAVAPPRNHPLALIAASLLVLTEERELRTLELLCHHFPRILPDDSATEQNIHISVLLQVRSLS